MKIHQWQKQTKEVSLVDALKAKRFALRYIHDGDAVLDIGCGNCDFLDLVKKERQKARLHAFDIEREARKIAEEKGYTFHSTFSITHRFNAITLFECFEHLTYQERIDYAKHISSLLVKGGYIILSVPHIKSSLSMAHYYDNPQHKQPFPLESNILTFFEGYSLVDKCYLTPWLNPFKILSCLVTGLSFTALYNNVCFVLRKEF